MIIYETDDQFKVVKLTRNTYAIFEYFLYFRIQFGDPNDSLLLFQPTRRYVEQNGESTVTVRFEQTVTKRRKKVRQWQSSSQSI